MLSLSTIALSCRGIIALTDQLGPSVSRVDAVIESYVFASVKLPSSAICVRNLDVSMDFYAVTQSEVCHICSVDL